MAVKSYGFAVGNLRARENTLLKNSSLLQLLNAENTQELSVMLRDKGIGDSSLSEPNELIKSHTAELWSYLTEMAPDMIAFSPFIYENDFHNLKAVIKAVLKNREYNDLLILPATVEAELLGRAVKEQKFDILPEFMCYAAKNAYETLAHTCDAQLADGIIDAACMKAQLDTAEKSKVGIVKELVEIMVFYSNIKVALRAAKAGRNAEFLESTLIDMPIIPKKELKMAALSGEEKVLELLSKAISMSGDKAAESYREAPWKLEKLADDLVISKAKRCRMVTMGIEPLIGYMCARRTELMNLRIIYSGVKTGQQEEKIKERLRELYG